MSRPRRQPGNVTFSDREYEERLVAVRRYMAGRGVEVALVSTPENIFYLTGLDHFGYFAPHILVIPAAAEPALVTREMEQVTVANQVRTARFVGHGDGESVVDAVLGLLRPLPGRPVIGLERGSNGLPLALGQALIAGLPNAGWVDLTGAIDDLRAVKSSAEQACMRAAARVSDAAMAAAIDAIREGAPEREVAAACHRAMILAGSAPPGFGPFIRPGARLGEEHTTWGDGTLEAGDVVFLELAGCVQRYHAPVGRVVFVGEAPPGTARIAAVCRDAFEAALRALRPGARAGQVYATWQAAVDAAGLAHYRRHHCGYVVGIGFPPSWTGGNRVTGLRVDSDLVIRSGMTFHILSWLIGTGAGDFFLSDTVLLGEGGPEILTSASREVLCR